MINLKRIFFIIGISSSALYTNASTPTLKNIVNGKYNPKSVSEFRSMTDGEHYTATDNDHTVIVKYSYKTGLPVDTLFNVKTAKECIFTSFDDYELSQIGRASCRERVCQYV